MFRNHIHEPPTAPSAQPLRNKRGAGRDQMFRSHFHLSLQAPEQDASSEHQVPQHNRMFRSEDRRRRRATYGASARNGARGQVFRGSAEEAGVEDDPAVHQGGQGVGQRDPRGQVGQQRHSRPRIGRPAGHLRVGGRPDQLAGLDDRQVRGRADG